MSKNETTGLGRELLLTSRRRMLEEYFPRLQRCCEELSDQDVWWRADERGNSVGNLVLHLNGNIRQWIVCGLGGAQDSRDRQQEFDERRIISRSELLSKFEATLIEAGGVIDSFDENNLLEVRRIQQWDVTYLEAILHVVEHFAQHLGQIIYITKLRTGRDLKFYDL